MKEEQKELLKRLKDPKFYLEHYVKIKTKQQGSLAPFILNEAQKDIFNALNRDHRIIICKVRQLGLSTGIVGYFYHNTITNPGTNTAIIGYNSDLTAELLDKVKTFYRTTPNSLKPTIQYNTKYEISFPAINSKILVLPSTENVGVGYTLHNAHITELSRWEKAEEKMQTLEASVPINGRLVIETTPHGAGDLYHRMWMAEDNGYTKKEYGWWWGYSKSEMDLIAKRMNDPAKFAENYGLAFLTSGRSVFEASLILKLRETVWKVGYETTDKSKSDESTRVRTFVKVEDHLRIFHDPIPGEQYVCGADVSEGVSGGDFSTAKFFRRSNGEEVASFRGLIAPDRFGDILDRWGRKYNNAYLAVEINNHGLTTVTVLKKHLYPSLYMRPAKFETASMAFSDKIGWRTTKVTRPLMIDEFAQACRSGELTIHSKETVDEMSVFVYNDNGDMEPQSRLFHDDEIFAGAIAFQAFKRLFAGKITQLDYAKHMPVSGGY